MEKHLRTTDKRVEVDYDRLRSALRDYVLDAAIVMGGRELETGQVIEVLVDNETVHVEVASVVLAPSEVHRVALRTTKIWPHEEDSEGVLGSAYYVCEQSDAGWSTRQVEYYFRGDDRKIEWFDLTA